jgi:hypothetical protein
LSISAFVKNGGFCVEFSEDRFRNKSRLLERRRNKMKNAKSKIVIKKKRVSESPSLSPIAAPRPTIPSDMDDFNLGDNFVDVAEVSVDDQNLKDDASTFSDDFIWNQRIPGFYLFVSIFQIKFVLEGYVSVFEFCKQFLKIKNAEEKMKNALINSYRSFSLSSPSPSSQSAAFSIFSLPGQETIRSIISHSQSHIKSDDSPIISSLGIFNIFSSAILLLQIEQNEDTLKSLLYQYDETLLAKCLFLFILLLFIKSLFVFLGFEIIFIVKQKAAGQLDAVQNMEFSAISSSLNISTLPALSGSALPVLFKSGYVIIIIVIISLLLFI